VFGPKRHYVVDGIDIGDCIARRSDPITSRRRCDKHVRAA